MKKFCSYFLMFVVIFACSSCCQYGFKSHNHKRYKNLKRRVNRAERNIRILQIEESKCQEKA